MKTTNTAMTKSADLYFVDGCGRCKYMATDKCKVRTWQNELQELRRIVLECGLEETSKWGMPVYTDKSKNVVMVTAFKESAALNFFKGALIQDTESLLSSPGDNSQSARYIKFTDTESILKCESSLKSYINQALEIERAGKKIEIKKADDYEIPEELADKFDEMPELKEAFYALTPGRQKAYLIFIGSAKQSATRAERVAKYTNHILNGKGMYD